MRTRYRIIAASILVSTLATSAYAGPKVLMSAPISNDAGGVSCVITNAGKKPVTVSTIETVGVALGTQTLNNEIIVLEPGAFVGIPNGETFGYCRFTIDKNPKTVRAAACRFQGGSGPGTNSDCLEAR